MTATARAPAALQPIDCVTVDTAVPRPDTREEWDRFVRGQPGATGYHLWDWRLVFENALGHRCRYLVAREHGDITGVLPLAEVRGWLFGRALSSLPYVNYGGVLAATDAAKRALLAEAGRIARAEGLSYVVLRHRSRQFPDLPVRTHKVTMLLRLEATREAMWTRLDRKVRNQIRKAEKSNLIATSGGAELLPEFYAVFARNMRDLGTPVYDRALFAEILSRFPGSARLHVVRLDGAAVAAALSYEFGDTIEVPSASSLREHRALCPNHLLYWTIIQDAIAAGRRTFDFGRSTPDDGTFHFKQQWGGEPEQLWWEYSLIDGELPTDDRRSAKFRTTISAWQRLPVSVTVLCGPTIARLVP
jgi:FemAB-related protein (PEP-CTERM system-associated)